MKILTRLWLFWMVAQSWIPLTAWAQAPSDIRGRTIQLTVNSGTFPFARSGVGRFLPSGTDNAYVIVPLSSTVTSGSGSYAYAKTSESVGRLTLSDVKIGGITATCSFANPYSGTYTLTSTVFPSGRQTGTFLLYSGSALASIAGTTVTVTITSGEAPFADSGAYQFLPTSSGTYNLRSLSFFIPNSSGTYSYTRNSSSTAIIAFNDSVVGTGFSSQLSFDTATTGSVFIRKAGTSGYQAGVFELSVPIIAPTITSQPASQTVNAGLPVSFRVAASGTLPLNYEWRRNGTPIAGASSATLNIAQVKETDAGAYSVQVSNAGGLVISGVATLVVNTPPRIAEHPTPATAVTGSRVVFTVAASGSGTPTYQWRKNGVNIAGAVGPTFTFAAVKATDAGSFDVIVRNPAGAATSNPAVLTVIVPPLITLQPTPTTVSLGGSVTFRTAATGTAPLRYEWRRDGQALPGATNATWTSRVTNILFQGGFDVVVANAGGRATSAVARLTVQAPPVILTQPHSQVVLPGSKATFTVVAEGTAPLAYQWRKGGVDIRGATASTYQILAAQKTDAGAYSVRVSNALGNAVSAPAVLTLSQRALTPPRFVSHSWRRETGLTSTLQVEAGAAYRIEASPDLRQWTEWTNFVATGANATVTKPAATAGGNVFLRAVSP